MTKRNLLIAAIWAWVAGLVCFAFPFLVSPFLEFDLSGFTLLTKITFHEALQKDIAEMPYNICLILSAVAGVVGLCSTAACNGYWEKAKDGGRHIIAMVSGAVGVLCLLLFQSTYGGSEAGMELRHLTSPGWGRNLALFCFIGATACVLAATLVKEKTTTKQSQETEEPPAWMTSGASSAAAPTAAMRETRPQAKKGELLEDGGQARFPGTRADCAQVRCPACNQVQSAQRKQCYGCGVEFVFDEDK